MKDLQIAEIYDILTVLINIALILYVLHTVFEV